MSNEALSDMHRVVKEVLDMLVFSCPRCMSVKRNFVEINKHIQTCDGKDLKPGALPIEFGTPAGVQVAGQSLKVPVSPFAAKGALAAPLPDLMIYIMEKDSKRFYLYNTKT
jgi:hypothetical protein